MVLYTAITRARNQLYLIEAFKEANGKKAVSLPEFAFRRFLDLELAKRVSNIDTGKSDTIALILMPFRSRSSATPCRLR